MVFMSALLPYKLIFMGKTINKLHFSLCGIVKFCVRNEPDWHNGDVIKFAGSAEADRIIGIMIANPVFVGGLCACFLDNTVPGRFRYLYPDV
jgi:hypothetical protein